MTEPLETVPEPKPAELPKTRKKTVAAPAKEEAEETVAAPAEDAVTAWADSAQDWPHEWVEFEGDKLAVRKPTMQALAAYSLAMSRFVSPQTQNDVSGGFMVRHMSPDTYIHVMDRLGNPDEQDYDENTIGELMKIIVEMATGEEPIENRAERRHPS